MVSIESGNRRVVITVLTIIIIALAAPLATVLAFGYPSHRALLRGEPVQETIFAPLVKAEPDPVMFTGRPVIETASSIQMIMVYPGFGGVNNSNQAAFKVLEFAERIQYLTGRNFTIVNGWTNLYHGEWSLKFSGEDVDLYATVNAGSGRVMAFYPDWKEGYPFGGENQHMNVTLIEQSAFEFLQKFNYSLSPHARYLGPAIHNNNVCLILFKHIVNGTIINHNVVSLSLDISTGVVLGFSYYWVNIEAIPIEHTINSEMAERAATAYLQGELNISAYVITTYMVFQSLFIPQGHLYRLGWIVVTDSEIIHAVHIDAKSGVPYDWTVFGLQSLNSPTAPVKIGFSGPSLNDIMWIFFGSVIVAATISTVFRRLMTKHIMNLSRSTR